MALAQKSGLPPFGDFPVHIQLTIQSTGNGYMGTLAAGMGKFHRFPLQLTPHDVKAFNTYLQQAIEQMAYNLTATDSNDQALAQLAETGNYVFKRIFPEGLIRNLMRRALQIGRIIQISSDGFAIPWELLYDGPLIDVDTTLFWGMSYIVARAIIQDFGSEDLVSPIIQSSRPAVGLVAYDQLEHVAQHEIPALQNLHRNKRIKLSHLAALDINRREQGLVNFGRFLRQRRHLIHFACHAHELEPVDQSYLRISDEFPISIKDFGVREFVIKGNPFIILNACLTSVINPLYTAHWAAEFLKRGVRGVLATELHIPDLFAAEFIKELYMHILASETIGDALQTTRQHFWYQQHNPLGLAYALYASPSFRIVN